jgi:hypothetical protein
MPVAFWSLKLFVLATILLVPAAAFSQRSFEKNPYVEYEVEENDQTYRVEYTFKDHFGNFQTYELILPREQTLNKIEQFGVPQWLFEPYVDSEYNRYVRDKEMAKGMFLLNKNTIEVDKSAVVQFYAQDFCRPVAQMIVGSLEEYGRDTRRDRIELAMRFVQDIPYGIPDFDNKQRHFGGVSPPPKVLLEMYGDCDSKVLLFVGILIYLIPADDIVFLNQPEHVLSAVKAESEKGLTYLEYDGETYLIAETAGPGARKLGQEGNYYNSKFKVEPLNITPPEIIPFSDNKNPVRQVNQPLVIQEDAVVIKNLSARDFRFQLSTDSKRWKEFKLQSNHFGEYRFRNKQKVYLRFRDSKARYIVYEVLTGSAYQINYDNRKKRWEVVL